MAWACNLVLLLEKQALPFLVEWPYEEPCEVTTRPVAAADRSHPCACHHNYTSRRVFESGKMLAATLESVRVHL